MRERFDGLLRQPADADRVLEQAAAPARGRSAARSRASAPSPARPAPRSARSGAPRDRRSASSQAAAPSCINSIGSLAPDVRDDRVDARGQLGLDRLEHRREQVRLVGELVVHRAAGDAGGPHDRLGAHAGVAVRGEQRPGGARSAPRGWPRSAPPGCGSRLVFHTDCTYVSRTRPRLRRGEPSCRPSTPRTAPSTTASPDRTDSAAPPVVFVHGLLVNGELWTAVAEALAAQGIRSYAPDLPLGAHPIALVAGRRPEPARRRAADRRVPRRARPDRRHAGRQRHRRRAVPVPHRRAAASRIGRLVLTNCDAFDEFPPAPFGLLVAAGRKAWRLQAADGADAAAPAAALDARLRRAGARTRSIPSSPAAGSRRPSPIAGVRRDAARFMAQIHKADLLDVSTRLGRVPQAGPAALGRRRPLLQALLRRTAARRVRRRSAGPRRRTAGPSSRSTSRERVADEIASLACATRAPDQARATDLAHRPWRPGRHTARSRSQDARRHVKISDILDHKAHTAAVTGHDRAGRDDPRTGRHASPSTASARVGRGRRRRSSASSPSGTSCARLARARCGPARRRGSRHHDGVDVTTCTPDDDVDAIAETMTERRIRHMPVIADGALQGMVSIGDVVKSRIGELEQERGHLEHYIIRLKPAIVASGLNLIPDRLRTTGMTVYGNHGPVLRGPARARPRPRPCSTTPSGPSDESGRPLRDVLSHRASSPRSRSPRRSPRRTA